MNKSPALKDLQEFSLWSVGAELETIEVGLEDLRNAFSIISAVLVSNDCLPYAQQFDSITTMAVVYLDGMKSNLKRNTDEIFRYERMKRAVFGADE